MNAKVKISIVLIVLLSSCINKKSDNVNSSPSNSILIAKDSIILKMGESDYPTSGVISYYQKGKSGYIAQCNNRTQSVTVYELKTGSALKNISLKGILPKGDLFCYNEDTILSRVNFEPIPLYLYTTNKIDEIKVDVNVKDECIEQFPRFFPFGVSFHNGKFYTSCYRLGEYPQLMHRGEDRPPLIEFDFSSSEYRFFGKYPDVYVNNNMGTLHYWEPFCTINSKQNILISSFKASPEIFSYSLVDGSINKHQVKSSFVDTIPLPLTEQGRDFFSDIDSYYNFGKYPHYGNIVYNKWENVYYRFVGLGLGDRISLDNAQKVFETKEWVVMVLDSDFNLIGEQYIGEGYNILYNFVTPEGLYILKNEKENKGTANYTLFTLNKEFK